MFSLLNCLQYPYAQSNKATSGLSYVLKAYIQHSISITYLRSPDTISSSRVTICWSGDAVLRPCSRSGVEIVSVTAAECPVTLGQNQQ